MADISIDVSGIDEWAEQLSLIDTKIDAACLEWEATGRIPRALVGTQTFFGEHDYWLFTAVLDDLTCFSCNVLDSISFVGLELRSSFRYLVVQGPDLILARVHPHCRCVLVRVTNPMDYISMDMQIDNILSEAASS